MANSNSLEDFNIRRRVWNAKVPLCITIAERDLKTYTEDSIMEQQAIGSRPFYAMVNRTLYFPLIIGQLRKHYDKAFTYFANKESSTLWLESNGKPLPWYQPIGLLFDQLMLWGDGTSKAKLTWSITLHFTAQPKELIPLDNWNIEEGSGGVLGVHFYSMLKQSDYIRHGSSRLVMNLSKLEQTQLWDGLWTHSFDRFWTVLNKLVYGGDAIKGRWKSIPLRIYQRKREPEQRQGHGPQAFTNNSNLLVHQAPFKYTDSTTIEQVLKEFRLIDQTHQSLKAYTHGIEIPMDTLIIWMALNMIYPDGFIHLLICGQVG